MREASETREPSAAKDLSERIPAPSWEPGNPVGASADEMLTVRSPSAADKTVLNTFPETNLKGLSHEIDFENVDENGQILALIRAATGF